MKFLKYPLLIMLYLQITGSISACHSPEKKEEETQKTVVTPVTVTTVSKGPMSEDVMLNATSAFQQKHYVKANVNGYLQSVGTQPGRYVTAGQTLFTIKTKEAQSIGNDVNKLDPSFRFSGVNTIRSNSNGYIAQLNHQVGDYVQDGEQLAVINDANSFAFLLNLPYELKQYVKTGSILDLSLPDKTKLKGTVTSFMPIVDPESQTQSIVIKVAGNATIPENLIARVTITKTRKDNAVSLPKAAVLTNDVQSEFWIMKLVDSNTAVKVVIKKGIETKDRVEIAEPALTEGDRILLTGNYGLPDTARVKIIQ
jgi:multidrug efflux pump subunit AcrA (membrane-fusion protein)